MFPYEDSKSASVCQYPKKRNHPSFVNISPTLVIDTSIERSSRVLQHGNTKISDDFASSCRCTLFDSQRARYPCSVGSVRQDQFLLRVGAVRL